MTMKSLLLSLCLAAAAFIPAQAQTLPPTTQQLQQQHDQTIRNEANTARSNLLQIADPDTAAAATLPDAVRPRRGASAGLYPGTAP